MADKIKAFFQKKVKDKKFKNAGKGYTLTDSQNSSSSKLRCSNQNQTVERREPSAEARTAGQAALSRLEGNKPQSKDFNVSQLAIQKQARKELESLHLKQNSATSSAKTTEEPENKELAIDGVFFRCPIVSDEILSKKEWLPKIREFIKNQISSDDEGLAACLIIRNCNIGEEKINKCIDILCKYLENIVNHPEEQKYWKIRMSNKVFQEKVKTIDGSLDLLEAAGFRKQRLFHEGNEEDFLVWDPEFSSIENVMMLAEAIKHTEVFELELDRNLRVYFPNTKINMELPPEFFTLSSSEIAQEQQVKSEDVELSQMLVTKAYREKMKHASTRIYKYTLIRIRFPDSIVIQGTFAVNETFLKVLEFLHECLLYPELPSLIVASTGEKYGQEEADKTLNELHLVPAVVLNYSFNIADNSQLPTQYLKEEVLNYMQNF